MKTKAIAVVVLFVGLAAGASFAQAAGKPGNTAVMRIESFPKANTFSVPLNLVTWNGAGAATVTAKGCVVTVFVPSVRVKVNEYGPGLA